MRRIWFVLLVSVSALGFTACESPGPKYRNVRSFREGLAPVQAQSGQWGYINSQQQWVIPPQFEEAREFQDGKAAVRKNGKWGFINRRGAWL